MELTGFKGAVALVTGAGGGMGAATAVALAAAGAKVALLDLKADGLDETLAAVKAAGGDGRAYRLDVSDRAAVDAAVASAEEELGPIGMLAHAAGIFRTATALEMTAADWGACLAVNATGVFNVTQSVARRMAERRSGRIVVVASQTTVVIRTGQGAYGASKAAAEYYAKCLGLELAPLGVRVNVVHPGVTETPIATATWGDQADAMRKAHIDGNLDRYRVPIPLRKVGKPEDVANTILFLLSDQSSHIALTDIVVDGGSALVA